MASKIVTSTNQMLALATRERKYRRTRFSTEARVARGSGFDTTITQTNHLPRESLDQGIVGRDDDRRAMTR